MGKDSLPSQFLGIHKNINIMEKIKSKLLDCKEIERTIVRLAHEIIEKNMDLKQIVLIGIRTRGEFLANRLLNNCSNLPTFSCILLKFNYIVLRSSFYFIFSLA